MLKLKIITPGKLREEWLIQALAEYEKRLAPVVAIDWIFKDIEPPPLYNCLHPEGVCHTSVTFSKFLYDEWRVGGSRLTFVIGGPNGISPHILRGAKHLISLSKLTFTHQHTRLIFLEQIYRAAQIEKGTKYNR